MSLFFRGAEQRAITTDDVPWSHGGASLLPNTAEQALRLIPVYAAVSSIADSIATLPLKAYRDTGTGPQLANPQPPLITAPCVTGTRVDWIVQAIASLLLRGNAYGLIVDHDRAFWPKKIQWLNPAAITVDESSTPPVYRHNGRVVPNEVIVHVPAFVLPGSIVGLSPVSLFRLQITKGLTAEKYANDFFDRGIMPPGVLKNTAKTLGPGEAEIAKRRFKASVEGRDIFVTGSDWSWDALTIPKDDAVFLETIKATATQIAAIYRVAPEDIGGQTASSLTYQTLEMNEIKRAQRTLLPWTARLEAVLRTLLPGDLYAKFNLDATARADLKSRMEAHEIALRNGIETNDEARAKEERPPLTDEQKSDWLTYYPPRAARTTTVDSRATEGQGS